MTFTAAAALVDYQTPQAALSTKLFIVERLVTGTGYLCAECGFIVSADTPCELCMTNAFDKIMANAECETSRK